MRLKRPSPKVAAPALAVALALCAAQIISAAPAIPDWLAPKMGGLTAEQREYLLSEDHMGKDLERLKKRLEDKSPEELAAYVAASMQIEEDMKFHAGTDPTSVPLMTDSKTFNGWKTKRPVGMDPYRKPGPFSVNRYVYGWSGGIRTFAGAPVAINPDDLVAGKVDVAIVGAPLDMGSGYRGAKGGPAAMRQMGGAGGNDMATMINPSSLLNIVDYGDIAVDNMSTELTMTHVREEVAAIARTGAIPFIVGGDHSLEYSDVAGLADVHGKGNIGVVHFDSHYDAGNEGNQLMSHGQPIYRLIKEGHVSGKNYIQVGLRGSWPGPEGFEWMREQGFRYHTMAEVERKGWADVMERALKEAREGGKKLYISFDVDVLDPAYVVGTGTPVSGGLTMREAIPIVRRLCAENDLIGFEIVELAPQLDPTYASALNANFIMHACLTGVAMRQKGIKDVNYYSDLGTNHGRESEQSGKPAKAAVKKKPAIR